MLCFLHTKRKYVYFLTVLNLNDMHIYPMVHGQRLALSCLLSLNLNTLAPVLVSRYAAVPPYRKYYSWKQILGFLPAPQAPNPTTSGKKAVPQDCRGGRLASRKNKDWTHRSQHAARHMD